MVLGQATKLSSPFKITQSMIPCLHCGKLQSSQELISQSLMYASKLRLKMVWKLDLSLPPGVIKSSSIRRFVESVSGYLLSPCDGPGCIPNWILMGAVLEVTKLNFLMISIIRGMGRLMLVHQSISFPEEKNALIHVVVHTAASGVVTGLGGTCGGVSRGSRRRKVRASELLSDKFLED
ncbi:hypothetical protein Aperf_G00000015718 [Anoplocephala perfoliata]